VGHGVFQRTGLGPRREAQLGGEVVLAMARRLGEARICDLASDSGRALANYVAVEPAWPNLTCRVRRRESEWSGEAEAVREAVRDLERGICGGPCPLHVAR
jgi:hypothetical protein